MEQEAICRELLRKIIDGEILPGSPLAPEEELARGFGVSRMKLHRALDILRENGVIFSRPRRGSRLAADLSVPMLQRLRAFFLRGVAILHASPPDNIHWNMRTVDLLGKELTLRGFRPKILAFESGRRPAPCTLAARAAELPAGEYGPVFILPSFSRQNRS